MAGVIPVTEKSRILVKNIPINLSKDKVIIYFQRKKNKGNGDVLSVTFLPEEEHSKSAVIEFEDATTVTSILSHQCHQVLGHQLDVSLFPAQEFGKSQVTLNQSTVQKMGSTPEWFSTLEDLTSISIKPVNGGAYILEGEWYQVDAAMARIRSYLTSKTSPPEQKQNLVTSGSALAISFPTKHPDVVEVKLDDLEYRYYNMCYPDSIKSLTKKYKVLLEHKTDLLSVIPASNSASLAKEFKAQLQSKMKIFQGRLHSSHLYYGNFPYITETEYHEAMNFAMKSKRAYVGIRKRNLGEKKIVFLALDQDDLRQSEEKFRSVCMPDQNSVLGQFDVEARKYKVSIVHGDFQREKADALLCEVNDEGNGRVVTTYNETLKQYVREKLSVKQDVFMCPDDRKTSCYKWLMHYVVTQYDARNFGKDKISMALELVSPAARKVVLPMFKPVGCKDLSRDVMEAYSRAIRAKSIRDQSSEICIIFNDYREACNFIEFLKKKQHYSITNISESVRKNSASDEVKEEEVCAICLESLNGAVPMRVLDCKHSFHQPCIDKAFAVSMKCPMCLRFYGKPKGNQPRDGTMVYHHIESSLPGYPNCGCIIIQYTFPNGIQAAEHPNPGTRYRGTSRVAYLPNNREGKEVLKLLKKAFEARITFTIGRSVTTGANNVVTWNDIHHKTSQTGGPQAYGYPDPTYLTRVKAELSDKGITL